MTLASQRARSRSGRSSISGSFKRRRRRGGKPPASVLVIGGVLVVVLAVWIGQLIVGGDSKNPEADAPSEREVADALTPDEPLPPVSGRTRSPDKALVSSTVTTKEPPKVVVPKKEEAPTPVAREVTPPPAAPVEEAAPKPARTEETRERVSSVAGLIADGVSLRDRGRPIEARAVLNRALGDRSSTPKDRERARELIGVLNEQLVFSPTVVPKDPIADQYRVRSNDSLSKIAQKQGLAVDHRFLARVNGMSNPNALRADTNIKVVRGPFHAVVRKSDFRLDLYAGAPPASAPASRWDGTEPDWIYIRSFDVGLGEFDGTPVGNFGIKPNSKVKNPSWRNPRTGELFAADDPANPIGEYWLAMVGLDDISRAYEGLGLHGTTEPDSIGREMSMGCVRMRADDIELCWEMLAEGVSVVRIVP